jgi:prevent-host-death family protein
MAEARGSNPLSSIPPADDRPAIVIGAHEFRNRFGWYMERAAAGEPILITGRGKPHLRLTPAAPQLGLVA